MTDQPTRILSHPTGDRNTARRYSQATARFELATPLTNTTVRLTADTQVILDLRCATVTLRAPDDTSRLLQFAQPGEAFHACFSRAGYHREGETGLGIGLRDWEGGAL